MNDFVIKTYVVNFNYFCGCDWDYKECTITALSIEQLEEAVRNEIKYISEIRENITVYEKTKEIMKNVKESVLEFPITQYGYID